MISTYTPYIYREATTFQIILFATMQDLSIQLLGQLQSFPIIVIILPLAFHDLVNLWGC